MNPLFSECSCLLCGSLRLHSEVVCDATVLVGKWRSRFGIEVQGELRNETNILKWHCHDCGFAFYNPQLAGTESLYKELQKFTFYYMQDKWEHIAALRFVFEGMRVLEIGSGAGAFLEKLSGLSGVTCCGLELNTEAVAAANKKGLNVEKEDLHLYASTHRDSFDAVAHFQVLEHVPDPSDLFSCSKNLLKPGGQLLITVPDSSGFIKHAKSNYLNMPPYHCTRWNPSVFRNVSSDFGFDIIDMIMEPLAIEHVKWFVNTHLERIPEIPYLYGPLCWIGRNNIMPLLFKSRAVRELFHGQSLFVCLRLK